MGSLTTKGKILLGLVVGGLLVMHINMHADIRLLMNQNQQLVEENEQLRLLVQTYQLEKKVNSLKNSIDELDEL
jgi:cell division protein FtsL